MSLRGTAKGEVEGVEPFEEYFSWRLGAGAGVVAAAVMGLGMMVIEPGMLPDSVAGLYGVEGSLAAGWAAHLFHGAVFGFVFAVVMADPSMVGVSAWLWKSTVAGVVFGIVLAVAAMGVVLPMWSQAAGVSSAPDVPFITGTTVAAHLVYGAVLGGLFFAADRR